jgi:hypothetical protein
MLVVEVRVKNKATKNIKIVKPIRILLQYIGTLIGSSVVAYTKKSDIWYYVFVYTR